MSDPAPSRHESDVVELKGTRRTAAKHMVAAWSAPVFHVSTDVDMTNADAVKSATPGATITDVLVKATAATLAEHPEVNSSYEGDFAVRRHASVNVGIAVSTPAGLVVPILHDAGALSLGEIADRRRDVVERARQGGLRRDDITGGTFTISNLGMLGVAEFDAIVNVPQVAILAVAATQDQYVLTADGPVWRPICRLTLTCDHRALDGAEGARFLADLKGRLVARQENSGVSD